MTAAHNSTVDSEADKKMVTVGLIQTFAEADPSENLKKAELKIREAAGKGAQIVCLQELYRTRYFPQKEKQGAVKLAETIPGESTGVFSRLAKELNVVVVAPLFEAEKGKFYNAAVVFDVGGQLVGHYRKIHVPQDPYFYEKNYFSPGNRGYCVVDTAYARVGVLICYDQWFPEAARINALLGAEIIFYPTAIGNVEGEDSSDGNWHDAWRTVQRGHAIANGVHVAAVNRVGVEGKLRFWGGSFVCDSFGTVLKEASETREEVLVVKVNLGKNKQIQEGWGFLRNRRPDTYKLLLKK